MMIKLSNLPKTVPEDKMTFWFFETVCDFVYKSESCNMDLFFLTFSVGWRGLLAWKRMALISGGNTRQVCKQCLKLRRPRLRFVCPLDVLITVIAVSADLRENRQVFLCSPSQNFVLSTRGTRKLAENDAERLRIFCLSSIR